MRNSRNTRLTSIEVPTDQNIGDPRRRGGSLSDAAFWWTKRAWLPNPVTTTSRESEAVYKIVLEVIAAVTMDWQPDEFDLNGLIYLRPIEPAHASCGSSITPAKAVETLDLLVPSTA